MDYHTTRRDHGARDLWRTADDEDDREYRPTMRRRVRETRERWKDDCARGEIISGRDYQKDSVDDDDY